MSYVSYKVFLFVLFLQLTESFTVETLNIQGPITIPGPFGGKEILLPRPPPTPPSLPLRLYDKAGKLVRAHPYAVGAGAALAMTVGLGIGSAYLGYGGKYGKAFRERRTFGTRGVVEDGMLKEAMGVSQKNQLSGRNAEAI